MNNPLKVIVVDDEPLARKGMLMRLQQFPELQVVAELAMAKTRSTRFVSTSQMCCFWMLRCR